MEKQLKKYIKFEWTPKCQEILDILKEKMVATPILVFPDWNKEFHVHVDASCIALGVVLLSQVKVILITLFLLQVENCPQ